MPTFQLLVLFTQTTGGLLIKISPRDTFDFWQTFIRQPIVIVGNSVGALVALMATHLHPEMSKGVVAISLPDLAELEELVPKSVRPIKRSLEQS